MEFEFVYRNGHVEVYDARNRFVFSADTEQEARRECREMLAEKGAA